MKAPRAAPPARELSVRLTPIGRRLLPLAAAGLALAEVLALLDSSMALSGAGRAGTLLFVPGLLLGMLALAPRLARAQVRGLGLAAPDPVTGYAGDDVRLPLVVSHGGGAFAARDLLVAPGASRVGVLRPVGFVGVLERRGSVVCDCAWRLTRRGRWRELELTVATTFPFGLVEARRVSRVACDVLAYPRLGRVRASALELEAGRGAQEARRAREAGTADLRALRDWREGESQRHVHWKVSARRGQLVLRELEGEERGAVCLVLVLGVEQMPAPGRGAPWHAGFEDAVSLAATLADVLAQRHPLVRLVCVGAEGESAVELRGRTRLERAFELLAEVQPQPAPAALVRAEASVEAARRAGQAVVAVHAGGETVQRGLARRGARVLDVEVAQRDGVFQPARSHAARLLS